MYNRPTMDVFESELDSETRVITIGAAGVDFVGRLTDPLAMGTSNPARVITSFGGVARNVAENLARLGQPVSIITSVGSDASGTAILAQAEEAGIDIRAVSCHEDCATGTYLAVINPSGDLALALDDMEILKTIRPASIRQQKILFAESGILFVDGNLPVDTLKTVMEMAKAAGLYVVADPTSNSLAAKFTPYLDQIFMITPNVKETSLYFGQEIDPRNEKDVMKAAKHIVGLGVEIVIVAMAELGVCYATTTTSGFISAIRTEIVDPTGAGDALTAAAIFALINHIPLDDAIRLGVASASLTLRHNGAVLPDLTLEKLYDQL